MAGETPSLIVVGAYRILNGEECPVDGLTGDSVEEIDRFMKECGYKLIFEGEQRRVYEFLEQAPPACGVDVKVPIRFAFTIGTTEDTGVKWSGK